MQRTTRDMEILEVLTFKVRLLTQRQVAREWWGGGPYALGSSRERIRKLERAGLVARTTLNARPLLELDQPVCRWQPGAPAPDADAVAHRLQSRWTEAPRTTAAIHATQKTADQLGGIGGPVRHRLQATHDLHLAEVYLNFRANSPDLAAAWVGEDVFAPSRKGEKLPDAILRDSAGNILLVIEFGGKYDASRVRIFHDDCAIRGTPYELW